LEVEQMSIGAAKFVLAVAILAACTGNSLDTKELSHKSEEPESGHSHSHHDTAESDYSLNVPFDSELVNVKSSFQIVQGEVVGGIQRVRAQMGEVVALAVASDAPEILHLHGYDLVVTIEPGISAVLVFEASIPGIFEMELENAGLLIAKVEIR
tara:strand:- start:82 stop:543 length:462 start_codon:yes stop_codon:yes gene_type:complete